MIGSTGSAAAALVHAELWRQRMREDFAAFNDRFLQPFTYAVATMRCRPDTRYWRRRAALRRGRAKRLEARSR